MAKLNFVLIGAAGFVAPRHMAAIKHVGGDLIAALDPHDSVGVLDSYFPGCYYFSEFERFDRFCELYRHGEGKIDFVSVCSPELSARRALQVWAQNRGGCHLRETARSTCAQSGAVGAGRAGNRASDLERAADTRAPRDQDPRGGLQNRAA